MTRYKAWPFDNAQGQAHIELRVCRSEFLLQATTRTHKEVFLIVIDQSQKNKECSWLVAN